MTPADDEVVGERRSREQATRRVLETPEQSVEGWSFHVSVGPFGNALDISREPRVFIQILSSGEKRRITRHVWTQGNPPAYNFAVGDILYAPALKSETTWAKQIAQARWHVQVKAQIGDRLRVELVAYPSQKRTELDLTQNEFAAILRDGPRNLGS